MSIFIREASNEDVPAITDLTGQLGYPVTEDDARSTLSFILKNNRETIFVALLDEKVIGWIGVFKSVHLASGFICEIGGLVVDAGHHRKGIGQQLMEQARQWSKKQGSETLLVRANVKRKQAHQFYQQLGFTEIKEQKVFKMDL